MAVYAELADGRLLEFPDGTPPEVMQKAVKSYIASQTPPKEGFISSLVGGAKRTGSTSLTGIESLIDPEGAARRGVERGEAISQQHAPGTSLEAVKKAYADRGLMGAAGEVISQVPTALAEQATNIAATLASAKAGAMAGTAVAPGIGTVVGGVGGALAPSLLQLFGSNIERQAEEGVPEISRGKALAAAAPGAALEVAATFIPLGRSIVGTLLGPQAATFLAKGGGRLADEGLAKVLLKGAAVGTLAEIPTEVTQQMLERLQAGLPLTTPDALAEYGEAAYGAGLVGAPFGAAGRAGQRYLARGQEEKKRAEEARVKALAEEERRIAAEAGAPLLTAREATLDGTLAGPVTALSEDPIIRAEQIRKAKERQAQERVVDETELNDQNRVLAQEIDRLETEASEAAKAGRTDVALDATMRMQELRKEQAALQKKVKDAGITLRSTKAAGIDPQAELRAKIAAAKKELAKAGDLGDFEKIAKISEKLKGLEARIDEARGQGDLFGAPNMARIERQEQQVKEQQESEERRTLYNAALLALGKRAERQDRAKTAQELETEAAQERAVKRLEFGIEQMGLSALGIKGEKRVTEDANIDKGIVTPDVAEALGLPDITEQTRSFEVLDKIEQAWKDASEQQRKNTESVQTGALSVFDDKGELTEAGKQAVINEVKLAKLTTLRNVGREAADALMEGRALETMAAQPTKAEARFEKGVVEKVSPLESQRLRDQRLAAENKVDALREALKDTEGRTPEELDTLALELRKAEAELTRVTREFDAKFGDTDVEAGSPALNKNAAFEDFVDPIYKLQRGEFFGSRPGEEAVQKAETERNERLKAQIDRASKDLEQVKARLLDPKMQNLADRMKLQQRQASLEGRVKTLTAGLTQQARKGQASFTMLVDRAKQARDRYVQATIADINGTRAARNLPQLTSDEELKLRLQIADKFQEFIDRASSAQRIPKEAVSREAEGFITDKEGRKVSLEDVIKNKPPEERIPQRKQPFGKVKEAVEVLREDLDTLIAEQRGDKKEAELPVETQKPEAPGRIIRGTSKIEKLADEVKSIDERLGRTPEPSQPVVDSLREDLKDLKRKATLLRDLQKMPKENLDLYEDDPVVGNFIKDPESLQKLYDEVRRTIPAYEKQLKEELAKAKERARLGEMKAKRQQEQAAVIREAREQRGETFEEKLSKELDTAKQIISDTQRNVVGLKSQIKKNTSAVKQLEKDLTAKLEEAKETRAAAKTDKNPQLRLRKAERLDKEAGQIRQQIATLKESSTEINERIAKLNKASADFASFLRSNGIETTIKESGEAVLTRVEEAEKEIGLTPKQYTALRKALNTRIEQTLQRLAAAKPPRDVETAIKTGLGLPGVRVTTSPKAVVVRRPETAIAAQKDASAAKYGALLEQAKQDYEAAKTDPEVEKETLQRMRAKIAAYTRLKNLAAEYEFKIIPERTKTRIFANNQDVSVEAEKRQQLLFRERRDQPKPPMVAVEEAVVDAKKLLSEAEKKLAAATATRDIKNAKAEVLALKQGLTKALMAKHKLEADFKKLTKVKAYAKSNRLLDFDEMQDVEGLQEALDQYTKDVDDIDFRFGDAQTDIVDAKEADQRLAAVKAAMDKKGIKFEYYPDFANTPMRVLRRLAQQGMDIYANQVRGGVMPDGTVFVIAGNHNNMVDLEKTIAHELIGHYAFDGLLGPDGLRMLLQRVKNAFGTDKNPVGVLAQKLGLVEEATAAYQQTMTYYDQDLKDGKKTLAEVQDLANIKALRELVAYTFEKRVDENFLAKAKRWIQELVGAFRAWAKKNGFSLLADPNKVNTSDLFYLMREADRSFMDGKAIAYKTEDGSIALRSGTAKAAPGYSGFGGPDIIAKQQKWTDRARANGLGLNMRTMLIDQRAAFEEAVERAKEAKTAEGKQLIDDVVASNAMYFIRMADQRNNIAAQTMTKGTFSLEDLADGKGGAQKALRSTGVSLKYVYEPLKNVQIGNEAFVSDAASKYLIAYRALKGGLGADVVDIRGRVKDADLRRWLADGEKIPEFVEMRKRYNEYNKGLVKLLVQSGAISKELGAQLTKLENYVPMYRDLGGGEVGLILGNEKPIRIGDLKNQPYLKELVGGEDLIIDVFASSVRNTQLLTDMALRNLATRNAAFAIQQMGIGTIRTGKGAMSPDILRFKLDGEDRWVQVDTQAKKDIFGDIPTELLVGGLEGIKVTVPFVIRALAYPTNLLKKMITRDPRYAVNQVFRESLASYITSGSNATPLVSAIKNLSSVYRGKNVTAEQLQRAGVLSGNVISGNMEDISARMQGIATGRTGFGKLMEALDNFAMAGETATKVSLYESFIRQGLSQRDAEFATMEAANMTRRGLSPSVYYANMLIPFFNAGIQGIDILYRAATGQMPYEEKLKVQRKLVMRGAVMFGMTMAYALMMQDDEAYKNARPEERYASWFVRIPGVAEPLRIPIPFEVGLVFKAYAEGLTNALFTEEKGSEIAKDLLLQTLRSLPGNITETGIPIPAAAKPLVELGANKSLFSGRDIVDARMDGLDKSMQFKDKTPELIKAIGPILEAVNLSPAQAEHLIRGYTGALGIGLLSVVNPLVAPSTRQAGPVEGRLSEVPLLGRFFQPNDSGRVIDDAFDTMKEIQRRSNTYKKYITDGEYAEADKYLKENISDIGMTSFAGAFRQRMGEITAAERAIKALPETSMSPKEKRAQLEEFRKLKIQMAAQFKAVREQTERQAAR